MLPLEERLPPVEEECPDRIEVRPVGRRELGGTKILCDTPKPFRKLIGLESGITLKRERQQCIAIVLTTEREHIDEVAGLGPIEESNDFSDSDIAFIEGRAEGGRHEGKLDEVEGDVDEQ